MASPTRAQVPGGGSQPPGVRGGPPDQLVAAEEVDEAVVGEPGDEDLRDLPQRRVKLKRARQPLADPLEQPEPVGLALRVPPPGLGDEQHDAVDLARRVAQRHRELPDEQEAAVAPVAGERVLPGARRSAPAG